MAPLIRLGPSDVTCGHGDCPADSHSVFDESNGVRVTLQIGKDGSAIVYVNRTHSDGALLAQVTGLRAPDDWVPEAEVG